MGNNIDADIKDPYVCISGNDEDCWFEYDYSEIMNNRTEQMTESGMIPSSGPNP